MKKTMKALVFTGTDEVKIQDVAMPSADEPDEVLLDRGWLGILLLYAASAHTASRDGKTCAEIVPWWECRAPGAWPST